MHNDGDSLNSYIFKARLMINKYHPIKARIYSWLQKFESVADYIGVPNHRWGQFLYSMLEFPEDIDVTEDDFYDNHYNCSYEVIKTKLLIRYAHLNIARLARESFIYRIQYYHETIEKYAEGLEKLHNECFYVLLAGERLKRQFINGLRNKDVRNSIKNTEKLTFHELVKISVELQDTLEKVKAVPCKGQADTQKTRK